MIMVKSQYPQNAPERDATRIQAEAIMARKGQSGPIEDPNERKRNRATRKQAEAIFATESPSQPIMAPPPPDTSRVKVREDDLYKSVGDLTAEIELARLQGDIVRQAELHKAQGVLNGPSDYRRRELDRAGLPDRAYGPYVDYGYHGGVDEPRTRPPGH
jgi:hypothetical protein